MFFELATLTVRFGTAPKASAAIQAYCEAPEAGGTLYGVWFSDIGDLNQIAVLRGFDTLEALYAERERGLRSADPFGCAELATALEWHSYKGFDWLPAPTPGHHGAIYEIRT